MAIGTYISIITLIVNGLKKDRLAEWTPKQDPYMLSIRNSLQT